MLDNLASFCSVAVVLFMKSSMSDRKGKQTYHVFIKDYIAAADTTDIPIDCSTMDEFESTTVTELRSLIQKRCPNRAIERAQLQYGGQQLQDKLTNEEIATLRDYRISHFSTLLLDYPLPSSAICPECGPIKAISVEPSSLRNTGEAEVTPLQSGDTTSVSEHSLEDALSNTEHKQPYQVFVLGCAHAQTTVITIDCSSMDGFNSTTITELRRLIKKKCPDVPLEQGRLHYAGQILFEKNRYGEVATLSDYKIHHFSTINLYFSLPSCLRCPNKSKHS